MNTEPTESSFFDTTGRVRISTAYKTNGSTKDINCPLPIAAPVA